AAVRRARRRVVPVAEQAHEPRTLARLRVEVGLVVPLDLGHVEAVLDELGPPRRDGEARGGDVLVDVAALEPGRAVHRDEPAGEEAREPDGAADPRELRLEPRRRPAVEYLEHP